MNDSAVREVRIDNGALVGSGGIKTDDLTYLLVIPDGVGIRNFFCTRFIDVLLTTGRVCVWHALPDPCIAPFRERWGEAVRWDAIPAITDGAIERMLRQAKIHAQLSWQRKRDSGIQVLRRRWPTRWVARLFEVVARGIGVLCSTPRGVVTLDRLHQRAAAHATHMPAFENFVKTLRPDLVFCAHQRALKAVPAMVAARRLGVPAVTFIYSWDNLPKGRMPVSADYYFVWSDFMKNELLGYYPDVGPKQVKVVGTPQFEDYHNGLLIQPREKFLGALGLDPGRPVVCFSGDDVATSPYDPLYLADLAEMMRTVPGEQRPQILFRRCPVDRSDRYDDVLKRYSDIAVSEPSWESYRGDEWSQVVPTQEDAALLVNVVYHCDLVINVGSTMAMDFAVYDKPAIFIAYNPAGSDGRWSHQRVYGLPHFRTTHELQPVYWARSPQEMGHLVMHALHNPGEKSEARRTWLHRHVRQPMHEASHRFAQELQQLALVHAHKTMPNHVHEGSRVP